MAARPLVGMQQSLASRAHEAGTQSQEFSRQLRAEQLLVADLRQSLKRAESHATRAEAITAKLRGHVEASRSDAKAASSKVKQQAEEIAQLQQDMDRERCMHSTASGAMQARIEDLSGSSARLQDEITALHATIQVCSSCAASAEMSQLWTRLHSRTSCACPRAPAAKLVCQ